MSIGPKNTLFKERQSKINELEEHLEFVKNMSTQLFTTHEAVMEEYKKINEKFNDLIASIGDVSIMCLALSQLIGTDKVNAEILNIKTKAQEERSARLKKDKELAVEKGWLKVTDVASDQSLVVVEVRTPASITERQEISVSNVAKELLPKFLGVHVGDEFEVNDMQLKVIELYEVVPAPTINSEVTSELN